VKDAKKTQVLWIFFQNIQDGGRLKLKFYLFSRHLGFFGKLFLQNKAKIEKVLANSRVLLNSLI
jgi:hypothetical protein